VADRRLDGVVLKVDGRTLANPELDKRLNLVRVEESVHLPDYFEVHFDDPDFKLFDGKLPGAARFELGTRIEIALQAESDPVVVTAGEITAISVEPGPAGQELVLTGFDLTHRFARGPKSRSFQRVTDTAIAMQIAKEYGLEPAVEDTGEEHDYVLQANETDYAFLRRRAGRIGFYFWISDGTLNFRRQPQGASMRPPPLVWKENLHWFTVRFASGEHCAEVQINGWDSLAKRPITGLATDGGLDTDALGTDAAAAHRRRAGGPARGGDRRPTAGRRCEGADREHR
jgi:phage protein D